MFSPKTLGGNVGAGGGTSFYAYQTADTLATVVTAGYFSTTDEGPSTARIYLNVGDIIQAETADGFAMLVVVDSTVTAVSAVSKMTGS